MAATRRPETQYVSPNAKVIAQVLRDDQTFPNSPLPVLIYRKAVVAERVTPELFEELFRANDWRGSWRNGIYKYHHYHSTSHEVLGVFSGSAKVQLGGDRGEAYELQPGDVVVIPAGVAHKNLDATADFGVVGAYPEGMDWDMNYGKPEERPRADHNISKVPFPKADPVYGDNGPLREKWSGIHGGH